MAGSEATQADINPNVENYTISRDIDVYAGFDWMESMLYDVRKQIDSRPDDCLMVISIV
jgi:hypothetical protein